MLSDYWEVLADRDGYIRHIIILRGYVKGVGWLGY